MNKCPFCPLERKTEWYKVYSDGLIICRDLRNKGYKLRILAVHSGSQWHHEKSWYSEALLEQLKSRAVEVANILINRKEAKKIVKVNETELSLPQHYHLQVCLN